VLPPVQAVSPMCEQCNKIDANVARYKRIKDQIDDKQTQEAVDRLLAELEAKKAALHPE
jgi:hypothetical protein